MEQDQLPEKLNEAIELIISGKKNEGGKILVELVKQDPTNEQTWLLLAECINDKAKKVKCFEKIISINPHNQNALYFLSIYAETDELKNYYLKKSKEARQHSSTANVINESSLGQEKICSNCGSIIGNNLNYCGMCGVEINKTDIQKSKTKLNYAFDLWIVGIVTILFFLQFIPIWPNMSLYIIGKLVNNNISEQMANLFDLSSILNSYILLFILVLALLTIVLLLLKRIAFNGWIWIIILSLFSIHHFWQINLLTSYRTFWSLALGSIISISLSFIIIFISFAKVLRKRFA